MKNKCEFCEDKLAEFELVVEYVNQPSESKKIFEVCKAHYNHFMLDEENYKIISVGVDK